MNDLLTALALVLVVEGIPLALFPKPMKRAAVLLLSRPEGLVRLVGLGLACLGVACVWLIRHH